MIRPKNKAPIGNPAPMEAIQHYVMTICSCRLPKKICALAKHMEAVVGFARIEAARVVVSGCDLGDLDTASFQHVGMLEINTDQSPHPRVLRGAPRPLDNPP